MNQKVKDEAWYDETGRKVPVVYISPAARLRERNSASILRGAKSINTALSEFKEQVSKLCDAVYEKEMEKLNARKDNKQPGKGNFNFFNFDRSIKIEVSISERIDFDDLTIKVVKQKLDDFLSENLDAKTEFVKDLVTDAFATRKGNLDSKKVMGLLKYRSKIKDPLFQEALNLLEESIRRPDSKKYFRVWERMENGEYKLIDLNFSSI